MAGQAWLVSDGRVLAALEIAADRRSRRRGLRGRERLEGALLLRPCRQVHTFGVRFPIDAAFCDGDGTVLAVATLRPRRVSRVVWRAALVIEAPEGASARWGLAPGDRVEVVDAREGPAGREAVEAPA